MSPFSGKSGIDALIHRPPPSAWEEFLRQPCLFLVQKLYARHTSSLCPSSPPPGSPPVSIVCISDTHNNQPRLPPGDILIHAGDLTQSGTLEELEAALAWLSAQPHPIKIVVAGNHDVLLDAKQDATLNRVRNPSRSPETLRASLAWRGITYLQNEDVTVICPNGRRLRVYGSPLSPKNGNWAFQYPRTEDVWKGAVPQDTDILVTHGPPRGHRDLLNMGCDHLLRELWRVRPKLHVFGHIHAGAGVETVGFDGVQAAYERTVIAKGGFWNLARTFWYFLVLMLARIFSREGGRCTIVNAAMVSGLRDELTREAVTVVI